MFTPDAARLLAVGGDAVTVLDASSRQQLQRLDIPAVMAAALSPKGTYLITFQRPSKDESGQGVAEGLGHEVRVPIRCYCSPFETRFS